MTATIAPSEVFNAQDAAVIHGLADDQFYFMLDFPDFQYPARKTKIVIGRGPDADEIDGYNVGSGDLGRSDSLDGILGKRKRGSQSPSISSSISEDERKKARRSKSPAANGSDSWHTDLEEVPHQSTKYQLTQIGGIGGPQAEAEDPDEDFVAVHPVIDEETGEMQSQSISRRHLRIIWDENQGWLVEVLGKNGCYVNENHYGIDARVSLEDGDLITLRGVSFAFYVATDSDVESDPPAGSDVDEEEPSNIDLSVTRTATLDGALDDDLESFSGDEENEEGEEADENDEVEEEKAQVKIRPNKDIPKPPERKLKIKLTPFKKAGGKDGSKAPQKIAQKSSQKTPQKIPQKSPQKAPQKAPQKSERRESTTPKLDRQPSTSQKVENAENAEKAERPENPERRDSSQTVGDGQDAVASVEGGAPQKRRGPGRPPADGVMSKRERRERQKALEAGVPYGTALPTKPKPKKEGETPTDPAAETPPAIKKPKKIKREGEPGEGDDEGADKGKKTPTEPPAPRAPTPKESDYPPEMLAKPEDTYQGLLYTLLSEVKEAMALPEIYEAMKNKWPYFRFGKESKGWESSVRHNLQSCKCFEKVQRAGKGWRWVINPEHPFERKSKRTTEPNPAAAYGSRYPPMQNTAPGYGYHIGYPSGPAQQMTFVNGGHRPPPGQQQPNGQAVPPFGQQPNQHFSHPFVNGQRPVIPPSGIQPPPNYASPYTGNNGAHGQAQNRPGLGPNVNTFGQGLNGQPAAGSMMHFQSGQGIPPAGAAPRIGQPNAPPFHQGQMQRTQTPNSGQPGPPRYIEPPADDEIRAGRTPAVVRRFLLQLRRISGADADKTMKQAEAAIDFIVKHPNGNGTADPEKENGAPASMVDVIRGLIEKQSNDSRAFLAQGATIARSTTQSMPHAVAPPPSASMLPIGGQQPPPPRMGQAMPMSVPGSVPQQTALPVSAPQQTTLPVSAPQQGALPVSAPQQTVLPVSAPQQAALPASVPQQTTLPVSVPQQTTLPVSAPQQSALPVSAPQQTVVHVSAPQQTMLPVSAQAAPPAVMRTPGPSMPPATPSGLPVSFAASSHLATPAIGGQTSQPQPPVSALDATPPTSKVMPAAMPQQPLVVTPANVTPAPATPAATTPAPANTTAMTPAPPAAMAPALAISQTDSKPLIPQLPVQLPTSGSVPLPVSAPPATPKIENTAN